MKKVAKFMFTLLVAMFAIVAVGYAQDSTATGGGSPTTSGEGVLSFFFNISGLVLLVQIVTGWVLKTMPMLGKTFKQLASWIIAIGVAFVGQAYGYGMFADAGNIETAAIGLGVGMIANNLYDAGTLDNILYLFFAKKKA